MRILEGRQRTMHAGQRRGPGSPRTNRGERFGFANSPRMSRFLRFVVEETVSGRAGDLKEYIVGLRVFDRPESFDPTVDPTVRVEASKLRAKLDSVLRTEGRRDSLTIAIPKGHYRATFSRKREPSIGSRLRWRLLPRLRPPSEESSSSTRSPRRV